MNKELKKELKSIYRKIYKYRKYALVGDLRTSYAQKCIKNIPETFEDWLEDGEPSLWELQLTGGSTTVEGKTITLNMLESENAEVINGLRDAIKNRKEFRDSMIYKNYLVKLSLSINDKGIVTGHLTITRKRSGREDYYLLINENTFIGVDVD